MSATVDYGIDLGTTNSAVAVLRGVQTEVVKNNDDSDTTASAVWVDRRDRLHVGRAARDRSEHDSENTCVEFKLRMGNAGQEMRFPASDRVLSPEQLSAEVLKSLRADVAQRHGTEIDAAVVTVPAAFSMAACDATRRAAELAGLSFSPLLQEPTAAALAYGFQAADQDEHWLVYDFGGGTFDAAIVRLRDGEFTVVNHRGDNFLGGKLIDWKILEELLLPELAEEYGLSGLRRGNPQWAGAIGKLKLAVEHAKIRLSRSETTDLQLEIADADGRQFEVDRELSRAQVARLATPFVARSVNLCRAAMDEVNLTAAAISRVILVGGPTLAPYLREQLADPATGLGIELDHRHDPMTAVARGAAIFAGTQRVPRLAIPAPAVGEFSAQLEYQPIGPDPEPLLAGKILSADGAAAAGLTVEIVNPDSRPPWRSGKIPVAPDTGVFATSLWAQPGDANTFRLELTDAAGTRRAVRPDSLTYTIGAVETQPPLTNTIGIGLQDNRMLSLIDRGTRLPARRRVRLQTTVALQRGTGGQVLRIPVLEGEHARADRNRPIGRLDVRATQVARSIPLGSDIELTVEIDASRIIVARAYLPILDTEYEDTIDLRTETAPTSAELDVQTRAELDRLARLRAENADIGTPISSLLFARLDEEHTVEEVRALQDAAASDPDAATAGRNRLLDLRSAIDEIEDDLQWPRLVTEAHAMLADTREIVDSTGRQEYADAFDDHHDAVCRAIEAHDADLLRQRVDDVRILAVKALDYTGELQVIYFRQLRDCRAEMTDLARADKLIADGEAATRSGQFDGLRAVNVRLRELLPTPPPPADPFSTVRTA